MNIEVYSTSSPTHHNWGCSIIIVQMGNGSGMYQSVCVYEGGVSTISYCSNFYGSNCWFSLFLLTIYELLLLRRLVGISRSIFSLQCCVIFFFRIVNFATFYLYISIFFSLINTSLFLRVTITVFICFSCIWCGCFGFCNWFGFSNWFLFYLLLLHRLSCSWFFNCVGHCNCK